MAENLLKDFAPDAMTYGSLRTTGAKSLAVSGVESPDMDARILLEAAAGISHARLIAAGHEPVSKRVQAVFHAAIARRITGEPVYRIIGFREFFGRNFKLSRETLEPRPETEILVEAILARNPKKHAAFRILDMGTGCGNIVISLLAERPGAHGVGVDRSANCIETAIDNAKRHGVGGRFHGLRSNLFERVSGQFEVIVSNPPYIETAAISKLQREVRLHDPVAALDGGADGLDFYRAIFSATPPFLADSGILAVETGSGQRKDVVKIAEDAGWSVLEVLPDLSGHDRVICLERADRPGVAKLPAS